MSLIIILQVTKGGEGVDQTENTGLRLAGWLNLVDERPREFRWLITLAVRASVGGDVCRQIKSKRPNIYAHARPFSLTNRTIVRESMVSVPDDEIVNQLSYPANRYTGGDDRKRSLQSSYRILVQHQCARICRLLALQCI